MSELVKLADFVKSVEGDENVSFVVAFKKNSADEAYYAPGRGSKIDNEIGDPVLM